MTESIVQKDGSIVSLDEGEKKRLKGESLYTKAFKRLRRDRLTLVMAFILLLMVLFSAAAPLIESTLDVSYRRTNARNAFQPVLSEGHILGTDDLGRDQLARLAYAGRWTLTIAFAAAGISLVIGVALGVMAGYFGGVVDDLIMWLITTIAAIPTLLLLIIVVGLLRPTPEALILVLGFLGWLGTARLVRGETISLREREFVTSARALGGSHVHIMVSHILPNLISVVVITLAIDVASLLLVEAGLSFLGLGVQPPTPTWGNMLTKSQQFFQRGWHLVIFPGMFITITVLCLYVIGDGIRDAFDPTVND